VGHSTYGPFTECRFWDFHFRVLLFFVFFEVEKKNLHHVSRETSHISDIAKRFLVDPVFSSSLGLLKYRETLKLNTTNSCFVLFWLKHAVERGYFPVLLFGKESLAESFYSDALAFFRDDSIAWISLFGSDSSLYRRSAIENHLSRFLTDFYDNKIKLVIASDGFIEQRVLDRKALKKHVLLLKIGEDYAFPVLTSKLEEAGYYRNNLVEHSGEYSIRGGIFDIYPYGDTYPLRLEFFGNKLESLRRFNPHDQNSFKTCENAEVRPASFSSFSHTTIGSVLQQDKTLLVRIISDDTDHPIEYLESATFRQIIFQEGLVRPDVFFSIVPSVLPRDAGDPVFYRELINKHKQIVVFSEHDIILESLKDKIGPLADYVKANISTGFLYKNLDLLVLSGRELFHKEHYVNPDRRFIPDRSSRIDSPDSLGYGDAVVHVDYGIGRYRGIELLSFRGSKQEAMILEYRNKDRVYVPIRYMNKIFRYDCDRPKDLILDRVGSKSWEQIKTTTRRYLRDAAYDLLALYRDRKKLPGYAFETDTPDAQRLASMFPYDETPDQLKAIDDVKKDMEKPRIMDRLICGDVGFGKTEVAIRAAFKAVYSGKQAAVLVPTTILCFQHYEHFHERLDPFGIRVEYLNRFVSGSRLNSLLRDLYSAKIDVLIGTHKILSNKLLYNDLGLLIIDEEHRFGVNHKETIRAMKRQVDVITLTATPIPRTLQLSLAGLRDISKIDTPPKERLPIATKIIYWNISDIRAAIERELERNGQVFILNNKIDELGGLCKKISDLFPSQEVRIAHGQMHGPELEKTLLDFYHHEFDILISTTIIESGIDVPNANTLIIMNAHTFGLSQLYQIRGRVGRSYKKAFAYLIIPRGAHISPLAMKRLQTLEYYTDLGSGYQIAMRDLEIRGAGNLFGAEQSGHINRVGYAYYNRLFAEEVSNIKHRQNTTETGNRTAPEIHLGHAAYFPDNYIENKDIRISFYRKVGDILHGANGVRAGLKDIKRLEDACRDRFGVLPREAQNLFLDSRLSIWLKPFYIESLSLVGSSLSLMFSKDLPTATLQKAAGELLAIMNNHKCKIDFSARGNLSASLDKYFIKMFNEGTFFEDI
jgi:transcription-repair coupling factor (superfamily II helicase)